MGVPPQTPPPRHNTFPMACSSGVTTLPYTFAAQQNWGVLAMILGEIEGMSLYNAINFSFSALGGDAAPRNATAYNAKINSYLCPSDPNAGPSNFNSYHAS